MTVSRPLLRYHGGKWLRAPWIIQHFPPHRIYCEPFGGAASVLLRKPRSYSEVYNDLDGEVVNLFRVLRNPSQARELARLVRLTPYAREEFDLSWIADGDPVEQARRTLFRFCSSFATGAQKDSGTGFRGNVTRSGSTPVHDWCNTPAMLEPIIERLRGVVIESRPALDVLRQYDNPQTLHYCDPPYVFSTRGVRERGQVYSHEMTDADHEQLATVLHNLTGMVIVSGYRCPLYDKLFVGWQRVDYSTHAQGARDRVESLWIKPGAIQRPTLF